MGQLILRSRSNQQPQQVPSLDRSGSGARLILAALPGIGLQNAVSGPAPQIVGTSPTGPSLTVDAYGRARELHPLGGANGYGGLRYGSETLGKGDDFTFIWVGRPMNPSDANGNLMVRGQDGAGNGWNLLLSLGGGNSDGSTPGTYVRASYIDSSPAYFSVDLSGISIPANSHQRFALVKRGNNLRVFHWATRRSASAVGGNGSCRTSTAGIAVGLDPNGAPGGHIRANTVLAFDTALIDLEVWGLLDNPWQRFKAPPRSVWLQPTNTGPTYTITGGVGNLVFAGSGGKLVASRRLAGSPGGVALAALAIQLTVSRKLSTSPGVLSLAGSSGALKAARRMAGDVGAVGLLGTSAKLLATRQIAAQPAVFSLTGGTTTFVYTPKPGGQGPTYTLTGGGGAFLLSASASRLLLTRRLVAATGAFSAAGAPVALLAARRLSATAGTFGTAGAAAGLRATRRLPAAAASFSLAGSTATFFYAPIVGPGGPTYTLTAVGGALGLIGNAAGLRARRRLPGGVAQFAITGWAADLVYGKQIVYARAPAGSGYTPITIESTHRPTSAATARPAAIQRSKR